MKGLHTLPAWVSLLCIKGIHPLPHCLVEQTLLESSENLDGKDQTSAPYRAGTLQRSHSQQESRPAARTAVYAAVRNTLETMGCEGVPRQPCFSSMSGLRLSEGTGSETEFSELAV